ncbi:CLUMA_CG018093, isoform A [Clunio marinus]|uniref:CLUMA_CG018093, isoform A n=1 Tax=Clunio marinus TaxID=568069 RepID=A0A1J1IY09_9DIPT|nr:CLUMA_CG018093, isoform A [Clunio marinus]
MKFLILFLFVFVAQCFGFIEPVIPNTKAEGCRGDKCGSHCALEETKIFPGEELNLTGRCGLFYCADNFDIHITPCPFDPNGEYEWIGADDTKSFPECCGTKTKIHRI